MFNGQPTAAAIAATSDNQLRAVGLSPQKLGYIRDLCTRTLDGSLALDALDTLTDEEVIAALTSVKGIGRWTAEMFLMFRLHRPDVLPVGDLGIVKPSTCISCASRQRLFASRPGWVRLASVSFRPAGIYGRVLIAKQRRRVIAMYTRAFLSLVALLLAIAGLTTSSAQNRGAAASTDIPRIQFEKYTLPNGLEVILSPKRGLPMVAVNLWYHVGPANEEKGRTGFAHLFEHMMFQSSKHVPPDSHLRLLERGGASDRRNH